MTAVEKATVKVLGKKFNRLFVDSLCDERKPSGELVWNCICDCGNQAKVVTSKIVSGHTKSCGCRQQEIIDKNKLPEGEGAIRAVFRDYQNTANRKQQLFNLSLDQFKSLVLSKCYYCGTNPSNITKRQNHNGQILRNGIDRLDNSVGYILSNCVPCCKECNYKKSSQGHEQFVTWINQVHNNLKPQFTFNAEVFAQKHLRF
jgi:hypothetical protein